MQLIQPYVQKSSSTALPRKSVRWTGPAGELIQSTLSGNSGALTDGRSIESLVMISVRSEKELHDAS
jgi:hypothetical protein